MAITISGENNNDRILASDGVIDEISGINIVGLLTAGHINVGNNIQLGNAGIITATTFNGNLTGNVNSTSPLLLQTGGSERIRLTSNNEIGIAGANYGSSGQVLTSGGSGSAVSWTTIPTQVTISNNADNRVITGGSGTNLNGESELTYTGGLLKVAHTYPAFYLDDTNTTNNRFRIIHNNELTQIDADPNNVYSSSRMSFNIDGGEKLRITSGGDIQVDNGNVHIDANGEFAIFEQDTALAMTNSSKISMDFSGNVARIRSSWNGSGGNAVGRPLAFFIGGSEKLRISSSYAKVGINTSVFDNNASALIIEGRGMGTTSPPKVQIKGVGSGAVHSYIDLIATSDSNSGNYRGLGVVMYDEVTDSEWFSGRPYQNSDYFVISRKASPSYRTESAETTPIMRAYQSGMVQANNAFGIANVGGTIGGSGGTENWLGIKDSSGNFGFIMKTASATASYVTNVGIGGETNPEQRVHVKHSDNSDIYGGIIVKSNNNTVRIKYGWGGMDGSSMLRFGIAGNELIRISNEGIWRVGRLTSIAEGNPLEMPRVSSSRGYTSIGRDNASSLMRRFGAYRGQVSGLKLFSMGNNGAQSWARVIVSTILGTPSFGVCRQEFLYAGNKSLRSSNYSGNNYTAVVTLAWSGNELQYSCNNSNYYSTIECELGNPNDNTGNGWYPTWGTSW